MIDLPVVLPLLSLLILWVAIGQLFALAYPLVSELTAMLPPQLRAGFHFLYSLMPLLIATSIAILVFTPVVGGFYLAGHCHGLQCANHIPVLHTGLLGGRIISIAMITFIAGTMVMLILMLWRNQRLVNSLVHVSRQDYSRHFRILETDEIIACCIGMLQQEILVSRGIIERASPGQLDIIIGHELAHACRLDNLRRTMVSIVTLTWPRSLQGRLLHDLELASEQCCDQHIARLTGHPQEVANTLRVVEGWHRSGSSMEPAYPPPYLQRIALLVGAESVAMHGWKVVALVLTGSMVIVLLAGDAIHRSVEAFLSVVPY